MLLEAGCQGVRQAQLETHLPVAPLGKHIPSSFILFHFLSPSLTKSSASQTSSHRGAVYSPQTLINTDKDHDIPK